MTSWSSTGHIYYAIEYEKWHQERRNHDEFVEKMKKEKWRLRDGAVTKLVPQNENKQKSVWWKINNDTANHSRRNMKNER